MSEVDYIRDYETVVDISDLVAAIAALKTVIDDLSERGIDADDDKLILKRLKRAAGLWD